MQHPHGYVASYQAFGKTNAHIGPRNQDGVCRERAKQCGGIYTVVSPSTALNIVAPHETPWHYTSVFFCFCCLLCEINATRYCPKEGFSCLHMRNKETAILSKPHLLSHPGASPPRHPRDFQLCNGCARKRKQYSATRTAKHVSL